MAANWETHGACASSTQNGAAPLAATAAVPARGRLATVLDCVLNDVAASFDLDSGKREKAGDPYAHPLVFFQGDR